MDGEGRSPEERVIFFDGECNLCNGWVDFVLKRDPDGRFRFASLQSEAARERLPEEYTQPDALGTFVLLDGDRVRTRSDAALEVLGNLRFPWSLMRVFKIVPRVIRDAVYRHVAAHRYEWFGKRDTCRIPTAAERARFL